MKGHNVSHANSSLFIQHPLQTPMTYPGTDVLDNGSHVDDVIFVEQLLAAYFQVDLSQ